VWRRRGFVRVGCWRILRGNTSLRLFIRNIGSEVVWRKSEMELLIQGELEVEGMSQGWQMTGCGADARDVPRLQGGSCMTRACQLFIYTYFHMELEVKVYSSMELYGYSIIRKRYWFSQCDVTEYEENCSQVPRLLSCSCPVYEAIFRYQTSDFTCRMSTRSSFPSPKLGVKLYELRACQTRCCISPHRQG
jgi:hypothetical protein